MKVKRIDGSQERMVLLGMILDKTVISAVSAKWHRGMFSSRWGNIIAGWCVSYWNRYRKPPRKDIQSLFDDWANSASRDKETVQEIENLLVSLSNQASRSDVNSEYIIDLATAYFTRVSLNELKDKIEAAIEDGDLEAADEALNSYSKIEMRSNGGVNVLSDKEVIKRAFASQGKPLIRYKHGLGIFYGSALERDAFVSLMGPEKRGKTWQLLDIAWRGMCQGNKVAFFEVGDLSEAQIMRRFMVRAAKLPMKARTVKWPTGITISDGDKIAQVDHKQLVFPDDLDFDTAWDACQRILSKKNQSSEPLLKLSTHPNSTISINGIRSVIDSWVRNNWVPDIVVIDYADILAPINGSVDSREQINATWKGMRALSQSMHCLVVTATQAKSSSYTAKTISKQDFSEDKRKFAHVTGMVGLNATPEEKDLGIMRVNWVVLREEDYSELACCHVANCFALANPTVHSIML